MALVDPKILQSLSLQPPKTLQKATVNNILDLDSQMKSILDSSQSVDEKVRAYNQVLQIFLTQQKKHNAPLVETPSQRKENDTVGEELRDAVINDVMDSVPKTFTNKAQLLVRHLTKNPGVDWNHKGEIMLNGRLIHGSNLADLVNDVLRNRKTVDGPTGWEEFSSHLEEMNIPQELIGNKDRLSFMKDLKLPPGEPYATPRRRLIPQPSKTEEPKKWSPSQLAGNSRMRTRSKSSVEGGLNKWKPE